MAKRQREEEISGKPGNSLDELCRNIKRLQTLGSENLDNLNSLHSLTGEAYSLADIPQDKVAAALISSTSLPLHGNDFLRQKQNNDKSVEEDILENAAELQEQGVLNSKGEWQMSYEDANKLLKELYLERCARLGAMQSQAGGPS